MMLSNQEAFDKVVTHLWYQKGKSLNDAGFCVYRSPDGKKCAIGALIADEDYNPEWDTNGCPSDTAYLAMKAAKVNYSFGGILQLAHDIHTNKKDLLRRLRKIGKVHNLDLSIFRKLGWR